MALLRTYFFSDSLGMAVDVNVILPQAADPDKPSPPRRALWLLHGFSGDCSDWIRLTSIERYARKYNLAVIMPSAHNSGYRDSGYGSMFYTYISKELPEKMRRFFPLSDKREDNYIAGLSMGGKGALMIGMANPDQYSAVGCLSASATNRVNGGSSRAGEIEQGSYQDVYGCARQMIAQHKPLPRVYHAIGKDDFLLEGAHETRDFFRAFPENPFGYTYEEDEGAHTWDFWDEHIKRFLDFLNLPEHGGAFV